MTKRKKWFLIGIGSVIVLGGGLAMKGKGKGMTVNVATVAREDIQAKVSASGKIQAVKKVDITANTMGQVTRLTIKEGDRVKAGDFLLEIDPAQSRAQVEANAALMAAAQHEVEQTQVRMSQNKRDLERAEINVREGIISQAEYEQARLGLKTQEAMLQSAIMRVKQARANLAQARDSLGKTLITAPMSGVVTARRIEKGETAIIGMQNNPGTVLLTISDMSRVEAEMEVDETSIPQVKAGQSAQVRIDAYPSQVFDGEVTEVSGSPIATTNTNQAIKFKVKVGIKNPPATIKPGLSAQADIMTGKRQMALAVPIQALVMRETPAEGGKKAKDEEGIYLMDGGKAVFKAIKTGLLGELNVEVMDGVKGGETIITGPFKTLRDLKDGALVQASRKDGEKH